MTLALVRHGRTAWNRERRMQGRTDIGLDDEGRAQAAAAARMLARAGEVSGGRWERMVCSPLVRASETAAIVAEHLAVPLETVDELIERGYGAAEGLPVGEVHERWPDGRYPGAEPLETATTRATTVLDRIAGLPGRSVVIAHGTLLRIGISALTGTAWPRIENGEVILLEAGAEGAWTARTLCT